MTIANGSQALATDILKSLNADGYLDFESSTQLTIASDAITVAHNWYRVETQASAATDDLSTITAGANVSDGFLLFLRPTTTGRAITLKHNVGNILCVGNTDIVLSNQHDTALFIYDGNLTKWICYATLIGASAITSTMIAAGAVTTAKLAAGAVDATALGTGAVTTTKLGSGAVDATALASNAVTAAKIAADSVDTSKAGNGIGQITHRVGNGGSSNWTNVGAFSNLTPVGAVRIQLGVGTGAFVGADNVGSSINFPVAFSAEPLIFVTLFSSSDNTVYITAAAASTTGASVGARRASAVGSQTFYFQWIAIGPE